MKVFKRIFILILVGLMGFLFIKPIKTKAYSDNEMLSYKVSGYNDIVIFSWFNPNIINSSSNAIEGQLLDFGYDLLNYGRYNGTSTNTYDLIRVRDNHIINSYLNKDLFCYYLAYRGEENGAFSWTLFIFSYNNWNPNLIGWSQLDRIDFTNGYLETTLKLSSFTTNYICFNIPNTNIKLDIVNSLWLEFIVSGEDELNALPYSITNGAYDIFNDGYVMGYEEGYMKGQQGIENIPYSFLSPIFNFFNNFFSIEIMPGVYIGYIIIIPLAFGILGLVLYFWRKD